MSKRALVSSLVGIAVVGGITAGGLAVAAASAPKEPALEKSSVRYVAPSEAGAGTLTFTTEVSDDSGIRGLKVLAWPASSKLKPAENDLRSVESATCEARSDKTSRCTYTVRATKEEAAGLDRGTWHVSALAAAKDGDTTFVARAATFEVTR